MLGALKFCKANFGGLCRSEQQPTG